MRKQVAALKEFAGRGTELITVYITPGYPVAEIMGRLRDEYGQASNIKSTSTRKNVLSALEKIMHYLKGVTKPPENGIAVFCGNVSREEGKPDVRIYSIVPPFPLKTQFYRCESSFVLEPLAEMLEAKGSHGLVVLDGKDATIAVLRGKGIRVLRRLHSTAHAKFKKGGQCLHETTLVQAASGEVKEIRDVKPGEKLIVFDFDEQRFREAECASVYARKAEAAVHIRTKSPSTELLATAEHRFFCATPGGIEEKLAEELREGDLLLLANELPAMGAPRELRLPASELEVTAEGRKLLAGARQRLRLSQVRVARAIGGHQTAICYIESGRIGWMDKIPELLSFYGIGQEFYGSCVKCRGTVLPRALTPELARFIGYFIGDGTMEDTRVTLYEDRPAVASEYAALARGFGIAAAPRERRRKTGFGTRCIETRLHSKAFVEFLRANFPEACGRGLARSVPAAIAGADAACTSAFLRGLFDAEASASSRGVSLAMANEKLVRQVQLILARLGIISTVVPKKNRHRLQHELSFRERASVESFHRLVGFTAPDKQAKLQALALRSGDAKSYCSHAPVDGRSVAGLFRELGLEKPELWRNSAFLLGKRLLRKEKFSALVSKAVHSCEKRRGSLPREEQSHLDRARWQLERIASSQASVARIASVEKVRASGLFYDLEVPGAANFVAGLAVVHNSAGRFERIREEEIEAYYKRVGAAMDPFLEEKEFKGVIVGGPGPVKEDFLKMKSFNYQLKVLGVVDTGYADEFGLRELMEKSEDVIAEQEAVVEKKLVEEFTKEAVAGRKAAYGYDEVRKALEAGRVEKLLVSEDLHLKKIALKCAQCGKTIERIVHEEKEAQELAESGEKCGCGGVAKKVSETDLVDELVGLAEKGGVALEMVSTETQAGKQFHAMFHGLGAFLRY